MKYTVKTTKNFTKQFSKLDKYTQLLVKAWIEKNIMDCENPKEHGKNLVGNMAGLWRYRIGDYRLICEIQDEQLVILALSIGHRREIYK